MSVTANEFATFMANMPVKLSTFIDKDLPQTISVNGEADQPFLKDLSPQSLRWVEIFAASKLNTPAEAVNTDNQRFTENLMRYVGEVFLRGIGGKWDYDPEGVIGNGMPFIRPDSPEADNAGDPISIIELVMQALRERTGKVLTTRFVNELAKFGDTGPRRGSSGMEETTSAKNVLPMDTDERQFLGTFLPTVEPAIAAWVMDQAAPSEWAFSREGLVKLGKQLVARYDTLDEMLAERSDFYISAALRFTGETLRRLGNGTWRYGTTFDVDDHRQHQPYVQFAQVGVDLVPWRLMTLAFDDTQVIAAAYDALEQALGAANGRAGEAAPTADT